MERPNAWKSYHASELEKLEQVCADYRAFITKNKTERECARATVELAEAAGYTTRRLCSLTWAPSRLRRA